VSEAGSFPGSPAIVARFTTVPRTRLSCPCPRRAGHDRIGREPRRHAGAVDGQNHDRRLEVLAGLRWPTRGGVRDRADFSAHGGGFPPQVHLGPLRRRPFEAPA
jgi:hypothetical protein